MLDLSSLLPLIYTAFGWLLNEGSQFFRLRHERRLPIGWALADLLNIRHRFLAIKLLTDEIATLGKLSPQQQLHFEHWFESLLPDLARLHQRYEESVKAIAGVRPILAFQISELDTIPSALAQLRGLALTDEEASAVFHNVSSQVTDLPLFDEKIRKLAWKHGFRTWYEIRGRIQKPLIIPPEFQKILKSLKSEGHGEEKA